MIRKQPSANALWMAEHADTPQARAWWRHYCGIEKRPVKQKPAVQITDEIWGRKILSAPVRRGNRVEFDIEDPVTGRRAVSMAYLEA